jgi:hypothetical protein
MTTMIWRLTVVAMLLGAIATFDACTDDGAVTRVAAKMRQLDGELVVLDGDEMQALACARSRTGR